VLEVARCARRGGEGWARRAEGARMDPAEMGRRPVRRRSRGGGTVNQGPGSREDDPRCRRSVSPRSGRRHPRRRQYGEQKGQPEAGDQAAQGRHGQQRKHQPGFVKAATRLGQRR
jgi:hypothetical protein